MSGRVDVGMSSEVYRLVNVFFFFFQNYMLPLFFNGLLSYLVGIKRRTSRSFKCKRDNSYLLHYLKKPSIIPLGVFLVYVYFDCAKLEYGIFSVAAVVYYVEMQSCYGC